MATVGEFLKIKLSKFDVEVADTELELMFLESDTNLDTEITPEVMIETKKALVKFIPELLLVPEVSEGEFKIKFDRDGILAYYRILCKELGVDDGLSGDTPTVTFIGDRW
ncbi:DUF6706 family protein [Albibacterium profundi]|uniref:DUF6706 family protein n=1 Tax=Albibacterium profundi TaxID=3134906 RepID=A0ABV5CEY6_9SPHI